MSSELDLALKRLNQSVTMTRIEEINFRELAIRTKQKLKKIPFWVPPLLMLFWFLYRMYVKFGIVSFVSVAVSVAVSTNLVFLIPRGVREDQKEDQLKILFNTSPRVQEAIEGINTQVKTNRITLKQVGEKVTVEKPKPLKMQTFKLSFGDEFRASIIQDLGTAYLLMLASGEKKQVEKELIESIR